MEQTIRKWQLLCLLLCCLVGGCLGQRADTATIKDLNELRAQYLPDAINKVNFTMADAQRLLRQKCHKANVALPPTEFNATALGQRVELAAGELLQCVSGLANITQILDEMEQARPLGDLDVVFEKYCKRLPKAESCLREFNAAVLPCLTRAERKQNDVLMRIISRLLEFICYRNGDQIALFIAEEGPECLEAHKEHIANCMNATFAGYMPKQLVLETAELPDLLMGSRQCIDLHDFESCVLGYLEQCNTITPANIVESLFRYVRTESKCQPDIDNELQKRARTAKLISPVEGPLQRNSASQLAVHVQVLLAAAALATRLLQA